MKFTLFSIIILCIGIISVISGTGCANIIPPTGGPRDSLPPVLVNANPKDSTLHFKSNRITLTFNEFIDLQDVQQNLLFNPTFENVPVIEAKLRTLTLRIRDSLQPNTTYSFNFGNAIKDVNEGNILRNFTYVFSTGSRLDSLQIRGKVLLAENGKTDTTLTIVLHTDRRDSAVANKRPRFIASVDSTGNFTFKNLPKDTFAIYAIGEAGILRRYTSKSQLFAFADSPVVSGASAPITLYAYKEVDKETNKPAATQRNAASTDKRLRFTNNATNNQLDLLGDFTINFERPLRNVDTSKVRLTTDSVFTPVTGYSLVLDSANKEIRLKNKWQENTLYNVIVDKDFGEDTLKRKLLKTDTISFTTKKLADYGNLRIRLRNIDTAQHPVLQFIQNDAVVFSAPVKSGFFAQTLFLPGDYDLRILYDRNNNGKWDPGHFFGKKIQPEITRPITRKITVKPALENDFEVSL